MRQPSSVLSLTDFNGNPLPDDLLYSTFGTLMSANGYVYMCNVPDNFDHVAFCKTLGDFVPQYTGVMVGDVMPEPGMDDVYHSGNTKALLPHTEGYDFQTLPPRYIALWCVHPAIGAGGETTLADAYAWVNTLTDDERRDMSDRVFDWKTTDGVERMGLSLSTHHPLLEDVDKGRIVRFSHNNLLRDGDDPICGVLDQGKAFFDTTHVGIDYEQNAMLVWDNWRMLHARNAFTDRGRHLKRIQVAA
jgi:alpha-ketoglutarate-dependent taurine dioxygenase